MGLSVGPSFCPSFRSSIVPSVRPPFRPSVRSLRLTVHPRVRFLTHPMQVFIFFTNAKLHISISSVTISHQGNVVRITFSSQLGALQLMLYGKFKMGLCKLCTSYLKPPGPTPHWRIPGANWGFSPRFHLI